MENSMTKLPERNVLDGSKLPKTTTGEMKGALGKIRDYLFELFGDDSADKEAARLSLGIDLDGLNGRLSGKAERTELEALQDEIGKRGVPIGSIDYFATATPPTGYLKADGSAVGRETYPALFSAIGTTFGEGDGSTTFNLPDLIGKFAEGSHTPGTVKGAGLPNITGGLAHLQTDWGDSSLNGWGAFTSSEIGQWGSVTTQGVYGYATALFNAADSSPVYGASHTVQPPALTLLPCVKAFDAMTDPGSIDAGRLAQDVSGKMDKNVDGKPVRYVIDAYDDGSHWWRKWSDGWIEQGGRADLQSAGKVVLSFPVPMPVRGRILVSLAAQNGGGAVPIVSGSVVNATTAHLYATNYSSGTTTVNWYACGR